MTSCHTVWQVDFTKFPGNHNFRLDYAFDGGSCNELICKYTANPLVLTTFEGGFATGYTHTMGGNFKGKDGIYVKVANDVFAYLYSAKYYTAGRVDLASRTSICRSSSSSTHRSGTYTSVRRTNLYDCVDSPKLCSGRYILNILRYAYRVKRLVAIDPSERSDDVEPMESDEPKNNGVLNENDLAQLRSLNVS